MRMEAICWLKEFNSLSKSAQKHVEQDLRQEIEWENDLWKKSYSHHMVYQESIHHQTFR